MRNASFDRFVRCVEGNVKLFKDFSVPSSGRVYWDKDPKPEKKSAAGSDRKDPNH